MLKSLKHYFNSIVYLQIWKEQIKATNSSNQITLIEPAVIAVKKTSSHTKELMYVGEEAIAQSNIEYLDLIYPFKNDKYLINDFDAAEALITNMLCRTKSLWRFLRPSPLVVIHPMDIREIEISQVEYRALLELALGSGAGDAAIYTGSELEINHINFYQIKRNFKAKIPKYI